jgi:hypothetical protein
MLLSRDRVHDCVILPFLKPICFPQFAVHRVLRVETILAITSMKFLPSLCFAIATAGLFLLPALSQELPTCAVSHRPTTQCIATKASPGPVSSNQSECTEHVQCDRPSVYLYDTSSAQHCARLRFVIMYNNTGIE